MSVGKDIKTDFNYEEENKLENASEQEEDRQIGVNVYDESDEESIVEEEGFATQPVAIIGITLPILLLQKVDKDRGDDVTRSRYIRRAIESYLKRR
jgi:hypothetical protein